ncbi:MAG: ATP-binding cassette domain-containing protein [Pseudomonadota bacterium]
MTLCKLLNAELAFGQDALLDGLELVLEAGERVCLVGRNGVGKSTLLDVIAGERALDSGERQLSANCTIGYVPQSVPLFDGLTCAEVVGNGTPEVAHLLAEYALETARHAPDARIVANLQGRIEALDGWTLENRTAALLQQMDIDAASRFEDLSGGQQRRVMLARAMLGSPGLMILDEPTNHLDIAHIEWLESWLVSQPCTFVFTSHDRRFIEATATRIVELDRGRLTSWPGNWQNYLRRRAERESAERTAAARADRLLAQEEVWIRQGIRARRTRNEGRVRRLEELRKTRLARRERTGAARLGDIRGARGGKLVADVNGAAARFEQTMVFAGFDTLILRGDRIGVIGANGSGKTTLLRLLLGELPPAEGTVRRGEGLRVAYFDQHRRLPDEAATVRDQVAEGSDFIGEGETRRHVISYLQEFLFTPDRANAPVSILSGGERARLSLARLFVEPSNLLVMDEPTNDLDMETLELLEERLADYTGTLLLVSHDRAFLDGVVTSTLALEGDGTVAEYVGGYGDYLRQRPPVRPDGDPAKRQRNGRAKDRGGRTKPGTAAESSAATGRPAKLGFNEARELEALPARLEALEADIQAVNTQLMDPETYRENATQVAALRARLETLEAELEQRFERWSELEERARG